MEGLPHRNKKARPACDGDEGQPWTCGARPGAPLLVHLCTTEQCTVLLYYCTTVLLYYCTTVLLYYCTTVLLYYCTTVACRTVAVCGLAPCHLTEEVRIGELLTTDRWGALVGLVLLCDVRLASVHRRLTKFCGATHCMRGPCTLGKGEGGMAESVNLMDIVPVCC
ncbi:hypothetical protein BCV70DRAFT_91254 [Testicularia cyperi]|uniref:Uncharacterized protein n=1 Tax=Testicularia cyperi TaxID=1882483 RepID=A0A317XTU5_9BASI|nr:hypothetical protein BCV70DRAFT_91254 [Testicularia cyperi]